MILLARHATVVLVGRGAVVTAAAAAGDHSITVALITASSVVATVVIGPVVTDLLRGRRERNRIDHEAEYAAEQSAIFDHLLAELEACRAQLETCREENERLRRRRRA